MHSVSHLALLPVHFSQELPALDYASSPSASSSFSRASSEWPGTLLSTPSSAADACPTDGTDNYFSYVPAKVQPASHSWELLQPQPQRFPSSFTPTSLLLTPHHEEAVHLAAPLETYHDPLKTVVARPAPPVAFNVADELDDVVFAARYPAPASSSGLLNFETAGPLHEVASRNKQACIFCQSGRRKCDGNKNDLTACSCCTMSGRQCCWTKVKRFRGPNRARGAEGKPAVPSSVYRVRSAESLMRRIEERQQKKQLGSKPLPFEVLGADGWEPIPTDGFQVSPVMFRASPAFPATPRRPTQDLPSVLVSSSCGLATPLEPYTLELSEAAHEAEVQARLKHFAFPSCARSAPYFPRTPASAHRALTDFDPRSPSRAGALKRRRDELEDDGGPPPPAAKFWSASSSAAKMNAALALDVANQRLHYTHSAFI